MKKIRKNKTDAHSVALHMHCVDLHSYYFLEKQSLQKVKSIYMTTGTEDAPRVVGSSPGQVAFLLLLHRLSSKFPSNRRRSITCSRCSPSHATLFAFSTIFNFDMDRQLAKRVLSVTYISSFSVE